MHDPRHDPRRGAHGHAAADVICGLGGNDTIAGCGGNDIAARRRRQRPALRRRGHGRPARRGGNDWLNSKDGQPETVNGGPGADRGLVDPGVDRVASVEKRNR